jgi:glycosyltransferase involved in cell wall biosynthesis
MLAPYENQTTARKKAQLSDPDFRIAINGRFLTQLMVGVQRVAIETTKAMDRLLDQPDFSPLKGRIEIVAPRTARDFPLRNIPVRRVGVLKGYPWEQIELPLHAGRSLLMNLCLVGPLLRQRQLILAHDATVRAFPQNFSAQFRAIYNFMVPRLLENSDLIATVSHFSQGEIAKHYGIAAERITVCHEGADHITAIPAEAAILDKLGLKERPFLLGVGINSPNKNIENTVAAFLRAKLGDTLLVLTGQRDLRIHDYAPDTTHANIRMAGYVSDGELRALYEGAQALVFPSRYEGFGLPPVEAMQCGCPVIVSDQPALQEMGGNAVLTCGMDDVETLARHMHAVHADPALRLRLAEAGKARMRDFTWEKTARKLLDLCLSGSRG